MKIIYTLAASLFLCACGGSSSEAENQAVDNNEGTGNKLPVTERFSLKTDSGIDYQHGYLLTLNSDPKFFGGGIAAEDIDGDGDIDLMITRGNIGPNRFYVNNGDGTFVERAGEMGLVVTNDDGSYLRQSGPAMVDLNGDGLLDIFVGGILGDPAHLFINQGNSKFERVSADIGLGSLDTIDTISSSFGDYDQDGDIDMLFSHWGTSRSIEAPGDTAHLWRNDSTEERMLFTDVSLDSGVAASLIGEASASAVKGDDHDYTHAVSFSDINNDGFLDIVATGDFKTSRVLVNNGNGSFSNLTDLDVIIDENGMGSALGDYDNDGDLDWFVSSILGAESSLGNRFYENDNGVFVDRTEQTATKDGGWGWAACFADFNQDSFLDLYQTNGWPMFTQTRLDRTKLFINRDGERFDEDAATWGVDDRNTGFAAVCADFTGDGKVDVLQLHRNPSNSASLYINEHTSSSANIVIELIGTQDNTQAIGSKIYLVQNQVEQYREINLASGFTSLNPTLAYFAVSTSANATLRVEWPDGKTTSQTISALDAGVPRQLTVIHPDKL